MGERCAQASSLGGKPARLAARSTDTVCGSCRERARDAQVGEGAELDALQNPVPEEHREVLQAARALFEAGVTDENVIYGTMVCAAWASADRDFRRMRDAVLEAGEKSERWEEMWRRFAYSGHHND
jgi:hypothetical protein